MLLYKKCIIVIINIILFLIVIYIFDTSEYDKKNTELQNISIGLSSSIWAFYEDTPKILLSNYIKVEKHYEASVVLINETIFIKEINHDLKKNLLFPSRTINVPVKYEDKIIATLQTEYSSRILIPLVTMLLLQILINVITFLYIALLVKNKKLNNAYATQKNILRDLNKTTSQLELNNIIVGISHELNTPIGIGLTSISHLNEKMEDGTLTKSLMENLVKLINYSLSRMRTISSRMKMLNVNPNDFNETYIDFTKIVNKSFKKLELENPTKGLKLDIKGINSNLYSKELVWNIIIDELIGNAFHHSPRSSVVKIISNQVDSCFHFSITINNSKIPNSIKKKLLQPFVSSSSEDSRLGLGLFLVKSLVEKVLTGQLIIESTENPVKLLIIIPIFL